MPPLFFVKKAIDRVGRSVIWIAMNKQFVVYLRVSTQRQGESQLGLEAQKLAVNSFVKSTVGEVVTEMVEIESGKKSDRPVLNQALALCKQNGYTLLVAKLDRLSRNLHFITALQQSKVNFLAADNPHATPFLIHILVAVAEYERNLISQRTKAALGVAKGRGVKLGNPRYNEAIPKAHAAWKRLADDRNAKLRTIIQEMMAKAGTTTLAEIAHGLNLRGVKTNRGCQFTPTQVHRILKAN